MTTMWCNWLVLFVVLGGVSVGTAAETSSRRAVEDAMKEGNWDDALRLARLRLDSGEGEPVDLRNAVRCLQQLGRPEEFDGLVESTVTAYAPNGPMLLAAAESYGRTETYGHLVAGEFRRGFPRGGGQVVEVGEQDRVRRLRLARAAMEHAGDDRTLAADAAVQIADALLRQRAGQLSWRLQRLTDLDGELPEIDDRRSRPGSSNPPVTTDGDLPLLYEVPAGWDAATNDGERWRWCLAEMKRMDPKRTAGADLRYARFLEEQFAVQSLAHSGWFTPVDDDAPSRETSALAVETLGDTETIARLATGVRRFQLPEGHRYIELFRQHEQWSALFNIYLNRNQRPRAIDVGRLWLASESDPRSRQRIQQRLDQLTKPWVRFGTSVTQPAGEGAGLRLTFRNAAKVELTAKAIDVPRLLEDIRQLLSDPPKEWDHSRLEVDQLGRRLMEESEKEYLGEQVAAWSTDLDTPAEHRDAETALSTPLQQAGAYLVTAKPIDADGVAGAETSVVVWVADTVLVRKQAADGVLYQVLDAVDGRPIPNATVDLFGYRIEWNNNRRPRVETRRVAEATNADGVAMVVADPEKADGGGDLFGNNGLQWLATATTGEGRLAHLGFAGVWRRQTEDGPPQAARTFVVTDRPVYRPADRVEFKAWVGRPNYAAAATSGDEEPAPSEYAHQEFQIDIHDARGEKVDTQRLTADAFGGVLGSYEIPDDAPLGSYRLDVVGFGSGSFRVEEYRKPEFEVTVEAPAEPTRLGEPFEAVVRADYYAGTPVRGGSLSYKVIRTKRSERWLPIGPWDWLYGRGYGWLGQDAAWRSDWRRWGCFAPMPPWWNGPSGPPEVVAEGEAELDADGTFRLSIETQAALDRQPNSDHRYEITAEVTDSGRRMVSGSGSVLAARRPVEVTVWLDRGFYEIGDTARARLSVRQPDGKPVAGAGELRLLKIAPPPAEQPVEQPNAEAGEATELVEPEETLVQAWRLASDADGAAEMRIKASEPGRYRLVYRSEAADEAVEGGLIFTIRGPGFDGGGFDFGDLELVLDKAEYAPGETVGLLINTDRPDSVVSLFVRPVNGVYSVPRVLQLGGKSRAIELIVAPEDMPNFFVEAHTVSDGKLHTVTRRVVVPPESRVLQVEASPSATTYLPGEEGSLRVRLTDAAGEPIVGQATIAVYDRSVEAIAGGPSGGDIRERFWDWTRQHNPSTAHNLLRSEWSVTAPKVPAMESLGIFGDVISRRRGRAKGFGGGGGEFGGVVMSMQAAPMSMARSAPQAAPPGTYDDFADLSVSLEETSASGLGAGSSDGPAVRENFADTALWVGTVETDAEGFATVAMPLPESLTAWKVRVWAVSDGLRVGQGEAEVVTRKDLMVRLRATRFLIDGDEAVVSALVQNESPRDLTIRVALEIEGDTIATPSQPQQTVSVAAGGEALIDWRLHATAEGQAKLTAIATVVEALGSDAKLSDAMRVELPVLVHGAERVESFSAVIPPAERLATFELVVPEERRPEATRLEVRYSPTLVGSMLDAVPYLIEFPHGCTEQTLNRFLPAAIVRKTIEDLGVQLEDLQPEEPVEGPPRRSEPVFDGEELDRLVKAGVSRLMEMQLSDGGWGWFSGWGEHSSPHTTVTVVRGLGVAKQSGVAVPDDVLQRGVDWLINYRTEQLVRLANVNAEGERIDDKRPWKRHADNLDALIELALVQADRADETMLRRLFEDRLQLTPYSQATLGLALHGAAGRGRGEWAGLRDRVIRNLKQFVQQDDENQTAYLKLPGDSWWSWYGSEYEAQAYFLKLLSATEPEGDLASGMVKYLLANRRNASRWNSTRDTALVIEAMADYVRASGEAAADGTVEVWLDGKLRDTKHYDAATALRFDGRFLLEGEGLTTGRHTLELRKQSEGRLYAAASLANFTLEDDIRAAGLEVRVKRRIQKLVPIEVEADDVDARGGAFGVKVERYRRIDVPNLGVVESGDLVEVELTIASKNDYEYLILEDPKPAGFEPVEVTSGYNGNALGAYVEFRDERVVFYARTLARGERTVKYRLRAETPGRFSALPTQIRAMYAPDLRGNSDEIKLRVEDAAE